MSDPIRPDPDPDADPFRPPAIPTDVCCLHCQQEYPSYLIRWEQEEIDGKLEGFWCCPTPDCDGRGFGFDIFPTDPEWQDPEGRLQMSWGDDDDEDDEFDNQDELDDEHDSDFTPDDDLPW